MSLSDALITGRPFKRANDLNWRNVQDGTICITPEDCLAEDWIIKPAPLELEIYISPDKSRVSLQPDEQYYWDKKKMIEVIE